MDGTCYVTIVKDLSNTDSFPSFALRKTVLVIPTWYGFCSSLKCLLLSSDFRNIDLFLRTTKYSYDMGMSLGQLCLSTLHIIFWSTNIIRLRNQIRRIQKLITNIFDSIILHRTIIICLNRVRFYKSNHFSIKDKYITK